MDRHADSEAGAGLDTPWERRALGGDPPQLGAPGSPPANGEYDRRDEGGAAPSARTSHEDIEGVEGRPASHVAPPADAAALSGTRFEFGGRRPYSFPPPRVTYRSPQRPLPGIGTVALGKVVRTVPYGAFVDFLGFRGLVHISQLLPGQRVDRVEDVVQEGGEVVVRVIAIDPERRHINLTLLSSVAAPAAPAFTPGPRQGPVPAAAVTTHPQGPAPGSPSEARPSEKPEPAAVVSPGVTPAAAMPSLEASPAAAPGATPPAPGAPAPPLAFQVVPSPSPLGAVAPPAPVAPLLPAEDSGQAEGARQAEDSRTAGTASVPRSELPLPAGATSPGTSRPATPSGPGGPVGASPSATPPGTGISKTAVPKTAIPRSAPPARGAPKGPLVSQHGARAVRREVTDPSHPMARLLAIAGDRALRPEGTPGRMGAPQAGGPAFSAPGELAPEAEAPGATPDGGARQRGVRGPVTRPVHVAEPEPEPVHEGPATLEALAARFSHRAGGAVVGPGPEPSEGEPGVRPGEAGGRAGSSARERSRQEREKQAAILARLRKGQ